MSDIFGELLALYHPLPLLSYFLHFSPSRSLLLQGMGDVQNLGDQGPPCVLGLRGDVKVLFRAQLVVGHGKLHMTPTSCFTEAGRHMRAFFIHSPCGFKDGSSRNNDGERKSLIKSGPKRLHTLLRTQLTQPCVAGLMQLPIRMRRCQDVCFGT